MIELPQADAKNWADLNSALLVWFESDRIVPEEGDVDFDVQAFRERFPPWAWIQRREKCARALWELALMAGDEFPHELDPFHCFVLNRSLEDWMERERADLRMATNDADRSFSESELKELRTLQEAAFIDKTFVNPDALGAAVLSEPSSSRWGPWLRDYYDLLPEDIAQTIERVVSGRAAR